MDASDVETVLWCTELGENAKEMIRLVLVHGATQRQTALQFGVSQTYVSSLLRRFNQIRARGFDALELQASLRRWVNECTQADPRGRIGSATLRGAYLAWAAGNGVADERGLLETLAKGVPTLKRVETDGQVWYLGRRLRVAPETGHALPEDDPEPAVEGEI